MSAMLFLPGEKSKYYFYLFDLSTAQVISELDENLDVEVLHISMELQNSSDHNATQASSIRTHQELLEFLIQIHTHPKICLIDLEIQMGDINISSHDDSEVHMSFSNPKYLNIITALLDRFNYGNLKLEDVMKNPNRYLKLEPPGNIIGEYADFMELVKSYN